MYAYGAIAGWGWIKSRFFSTFRASKCTEFLGALPVFCAKVRFRCDFPARFFLSWRTIVIHTDSIVENWLPTIQNRNSQPMREWQYVYATYLRPPHADFNNGKFYFRVNQNRNSQSIHIRQYSVFCLDWPL